VVERGRTFIQRMVDELSDEETRRGVHFRTRVSAIIESVTPADRRPAPPARARRA
jgi:hypothetical protein